MQNFLIDVLCYVVVIIIYLYFVHLAITQKINSVIKDIKSRFKRR